MSGSSGLERRYRRLLACYPRAFRRENTEEILAVLLACAQEGQRRPGLAASADLIKGALLMRLRPAIRPPRAVLTAAKLVCAGAAAQLATLVIVLLTQDSIASAVIRRYPAYAPALRHAVSVQVLIDEVGVPLFAGLWLLLAWALVRGRGGARVGFAVLFGLSTVGLIVGASQGLAEYAPAGLAADVVVWLIGLAAGVCLFIPPANRYYRPLDVAVGDAGGPGWRGTFGTM
jgi:hypothetical protein